ncbi:hypothetical protein [Paralysiella testudinis]|uniref:Uncharacterized protein n=1 Tax=Paralysiella testudinis TaxID=2809020 RepID=A0A892ZDU8_9NEIS|nr:hypothetical protein [Paralysiella testudinis]QRQ80833.1 hypothetical protein JQU52_08715 [Paralysiella testudinis]
MKRILYIFILYTITSYFISFISLGILVFLFGPVIDFFMGSNISIPKYWNSVNESGVIKLLIILPIVGSVVATFFDSFE